MMKSMMGKHNLCTCVADPEIVCIVHPSRESVDKWRVRSRFLEHANGSADSDNAILMGRVQSLEQQLAALKQENKALTKANIDVGNINIGLVQQLADLREWARVLEVAIAVHIREEITMVLEEDTETDSQAIEQFLHRAAEFESDLSVANRIWKVAALKEQDNE